MPKIKIKKAKPTPIALKVVPTYDQVSERLYSNYVAVSHSQYDFNLRFCDIGPPNEKQQDKSLKSGEIEVPIQADIVIPGVIVEPLIKALITQYEKYKKSQSK